MNAQPFFSIIIPTYNRADLITKTIDSVLGQTFRDYEIIVVDNKSTDNTVEILKPYIESNAISFYQNEKNHERAYSRNRGFNLAKGEYVTLLDSDDILYPNCLVTVYDYIRENPDCEVFHAKYVMIDLKDNFLKPFYFPSIENPFKALSKGNFLANLCIFYKASVIKDVKFDENPIMIGIEDYDFVIRLVGHAGHLGRIDQVLGGLREHESRSVHLEEWDKTLRRIDFFLEKHTDPTSKMFAHSKSLKANLDLYLCSFAATRYNFATAMKYLFRSFGNYPVITFSSKFWHHQLVIYKYFIRYLFKKKR